MAGGGQLAAAAVRGIDTGLQIVDRLQNQERLQRKDALDLEDRARTNRRQDEADALVRKDRDDEDALRDLRGANYLITNGMDLPEDMEKRLGARGIYPKKYQQPQMQSYLGAVNGVLSGDFSQKRAAIDGFDWRYREQITRMDGTEYENDVKTENGLIEKGSTRQSTRVVGIYPSMGKDGMPDGRGVMLQLEVVAKTKDGRTITYRPPATEDRSSKEGANVLLIPMEKLTSNLHADEAYTYALNHPDARVQFEAEMLRHGEDPTKLRAGLAERKTLAEIGRIEAETGAANARAAAAPVMAQAAVERARRAGGGGAGTAYERNTQMVADAMFKGDKVKALQWMKTSGKSPAGVAMITAYLLKRQDKKKVPKTIKQGEWGKRVEVPNPDYMTEEQAAAKARKMMAVADDTPDPEGAMGGEDAANPAAESDDLDSYVNDLLDE